MMIDEHFERAVLVQRERDLLAWVAAHRKRIATLPPGERHEATAKLERFARRELSR